MEKKGEFLNQMAIISDLLEKVNLNIKSTTVIIELDKKEFDEVFSKVQKKYGKKSTIPEKTFTLNIGFVDIVFNMNNV